MIKSPFRCYNVVSGIFCDVHVPAAARMSFEDPIAHEQDSLSLA
jgi:hypothetical protein